MKMITVIEFELMRLKGVKFIVSLHNITINVENLRRVANFMEELKASDANSAFTEEADAWGIIDSVLANSEAHKFILPSIELKINGVEELFVPGDLRIKYQRVELLEADDLKVSLGHKQAA